MNRHYFYIDTDGKQEGPVDIEGLRHRAITRETLIWYEGLADWTPAANIFELKDIFYTPQTPPTYEPPTQSVHAATPNVTQQQQIPLPKTWLLESILVTILCCVPFGIVGIVYASRVESLWYAGRYEESLRASCNAGLWTKWGFFLVLALGLLYILALLIFPATLLSLAMFNHF